MRKAYEVLVPITGQLIVLSGQLDVRTVSDVRDELHAAVDAGSGRLVIDMRDVDLVDATGLGVLVGTHRRAERAGRRLVLRGTPERLRRLLRATRLERVLPTEPERAPVEPERAPGFGAPTHQVAVSEPCSAA
ncbi:MAG: STAS domain-containing protein [Micromonosporaceae bacterium]